MKRNRIRMSRKEYFQKAARDYRAEKGVAEVDPDAVADWMVETGRYEERPSTPAKRCRQELVKYMKDERTIDPQGREVRLNHPVPMTRNGETKTLWGTIWELAPRFMRRSLGGRMRQIEATIARHRTDNLSYNDNNKHGGQVMLFDYDFNKMIAERDQPTEYPEAPPPDHEDGDEPS